MVECWAGHLFQTPVAHDPVLCQTCPQTRMSISGLVVEYIIAIDVARVRFPADARHHRIYFRADPLITQRLIFG